ncbi:MAG: serine hydroxymethyltransferase [Candidatus Kerfeldbacteria bacterium RIFCSPHIGHO2_12_FULL_48_17]|uniref:Serine hydroxymethyltransferase n=1 Tax=Candidatus Kerfeldbacteria bacterium RIFCSPHIGHO2_12_FULL_48_17 TaxID=1798542 RepID=A0A1G2B566_9BACT|nr:MAG: serine hydroxymethyltransferase [Candidatus Kerfeldbacteria bacterium RIFCSPHIGHO2_12_FULL_48_17]
MKHIQHSDPVIAGFIMQEIRRQEEGLEMIPSENNTSLAVMEAVGSPLTDKYSEGYAGKRYYGGNEFIDKIEIEAIDRAKRLFGADHANVQSHSGSDANLAAYLAVMNPGDTFLGMDLTCGGHLTHGHKVSAVSRIFRPVQYKVDKKTELLDFDEIAALAREHKPKVIVAGATAYPRTIDFAKFGEIAAEVGAKLVADLSHIAGLVVTGVHPHAFPYADIITTTTHKTLRGPRGAMILCKAELGQAIDKSVMPGLQGGPLDHVIAGKAVAFGEALQPGFKHYAQQIVKNAKVLEQVFAAAGLRLVTGGTDNHLLLVDVTPLSLTGKKAQNILGSVGITVNKNTVPFDTRTPFDPSGVRLGTPSLTTRGMKEDDMKKVGDLIVRALTKAHDEAALELVRGEVRELAKQFPIHPELLA